MDFATLKAHFEHQDRFAELLGIQIEEARSGYARVSMALREDCRNGVGLAHGGAIFTLADLAFAIGSNAERDTVALSAQTSLSFLKPGKSGPLTAEARVLHEGKTLVVYDVEVRDGTGTLIASARMTGARTALVMEQGEKHAG